MQTLIIVFCILILIVLAIVIYLLIKNQQPKEDNSSKLILELNENLRKEIQETRKELNEKEEKSRLSMQERLDKINELISGHQKATVENIQRQFVQSSKIIQEVTEKLTQMEGTSKQILNFAERMKSLENILQNPKQRGILGEYFLETLLTNVLQPNQYQMQYSFANGEKVDAVVFFKDKIIPIDAKFSLEKYNQMVQSNDKVQRDKLEQEFKRDVKNRIDETTKYIRPNENTTEFAFMFIPAEGIYYNLLIYNVGTIELNTHDLIEYAFKKRVIIVSPTSFYAYLETVLQGLKALKMEESIKDVIKWVGELNKHLNAYESYFVKVGNNLKTTVNSYNEASNEFKKIDKDIYKITDGQQGGELSPLTLEKPKLEIE